MTGIASSISWRLVFAAVAFASLAPATLSAQPAASRFFAGKQIDLIIGSTSGGGYDTYGRLIARHMDRYIPGNPTFVPKNMPGAGSAKAIGFISSAAPKDGTVMGAVFSGAIVEPLLNEKSKAPYDPTKLIYVGSANNEVFICAARSDSPMKKFEDALTHEILLGATAAGGSTRDFPSVLNNVLGTKFTVISGYPGSREVTLAIERNEVQGVCGYGWSSLIAQNAAMLDSGTLKVMVQEAAKSHPDLDKMGVPMAVNFAKNAEDRRVLELIYGQLVFGRPYILPPGVPEDRVALLRKAFDQTMKDEKFLADAKKSRLDVDAVSGQEVQTLVTKMYETPPHIVARARDALIYKGKK